VVAAAALSALPVLYILDPSRTHLPLCPLHALTGLNCPLCGATRATHSLLHGNVGLALHDNALYVLGLPFLVVLYARWAAISQRPSAASDDVRSRRIVRPGVLVVALLVMLGFGIVRNLPFGEFLSPPT
jgi:hypothetical protein